METKYYLVTNDIREITTDYIRFVVETVDGETVTERIPRTYKGEEIIWKPTKKGIMVHSAHIEKNGLYLTLAPNQ